MSVIVVEFVTLDGVVEDPDGSAGTATGGWAFRHGPEAIAGDKFRLGPVLDTGALLLGRTTWELFSRIWPGRTGEFADRLNAAPKLVASRTLDNVDAWHNSALVKGDLVEAVRREERDLVVIGSVGIAHLLAEHDLVDEYRLLIFPDALGTGRPLFVKPVRLSLVSAEQVGPAILSTYRTTKA